MSRNSKIYVGVKTEGSDRSFGVQEFARMTINVGLSPKTSYVMANVEVEVYEDDDHYKYTLYAGSNLIKTVYLDKKTKVFTED